MDMRHLTRRNFIAGAAAFGNHAFTDNGLRTKATDKAELVEEYGPFVKNYLFAVATGHYRLEVSDEGVSVAFYGGDARAPSQIFRLR